MSKNPQDFGTIGVLMGGVSSEREISLKSGKAVTEALLAAGHSVKPLDITFADGKRIARFIRDARIDVAFIALHGKLGEDGTIQSILESLKIPYPGSGTKASRLAFNKATTQKLLKNNGLPVADFKIWSEDKEGNIHEEGGTFKNLNGFPVVVKPACEGSSIGVTIVHQKANFEVALRMAFRYGKEVLVERFIRGREMTVGILDEEALPVIEILPQSGFFDFTAKYQPGLTEYIVPAAIDERLSKDIQEISLKAVRLLGCRHFSRVDLMLDEKHNPFILEVNTIPGFTATSLLPKAAKARGLDFTQLCLKLIELAYSERKEATAVRPRSFTRKSV